MSEIKYGLISKTDAETLEKTVDLICVAFPNEIVNVTEVGIYSGETMKGIVNYIGSKGRSLDTTGVDNFKDKQQIIFRYYSRILQGDSGEMAYKIQDNSQHLIFIDGCHCFAHVVSDFFCYAPKVKVGGYLAFHDTGKHIQSFKDFQHGDKENPDAYISVRRALEKIGLLKFKRVWYVPGSVDMGGNECLFEGWELIFDEADPENPAGGVTVFKKLY